MLQPGKINRLPIVEIVSEGCYFDTSIAVGANNSVWGKTESQRLFLPRSQMPATNVSARLEHSSDAASDQCAQLSVGDKLDVFVYTNADGEFVATTSQPKAVVGECAYLTVLCVNDHGAFLDWGLPKDLLLPFGEQAYPVVEGKRYVVYVYLDEQTNRVACSTKLHHHLPEAYMPPSSGSLSSAKLKPYQAVDLLIAAKSDLGYKAVVNGEYLGLIFHQDLGHPLRFGEHMKGWVKAIRPDGKIDLSVNALDAKSRGELAERILDYLKESGGRANLSDKSSPQEIFRVFKVSKKNFKRALSTLYKERLIRIETSFIELV